MNIVNKITIGSINGVRKGFKDVVARRHVARIIGIARSADLKQSENMGDSWKFIGEFRAWNQKGEMFTSPVCFLPHEAQATLKAAVEADKAGAGVEFAFDFYIRPDDKAALKYVYETHPLIEVRASSALAAFAGSLPKLAHEEKTQEGEGAKPDSDHKAKGRK